MKGISVALLLGWAYLSLGFVSVKPMVVYGEDNRKDLHEVIDQGVLEAAESTVALIEGRRIREVSPGNFTISTGSFAEEFNLCKDEPFYEQRTAANCSGFLVGDDLVATAGHCISEYECAEYKFVFGFSEKTQGQQEYSASADDIYSCKSIVTQQLSSTEDYALVQLDRPVKGRKALRMAAQPAATGDEILVIGHPSGLPTKVADGATVRRQVGAFFVANLDTYGGNSGSAVFNSRSLEVVGILVRGENDFRYDYAQGCNRTNKCDMQGCRGEDVTNISYINEALAKTKE